MEQSYVPCGFLVRSPGGPDVEFTSAQSDQVRDVKIEM